MNNSGIDTFELKPHHLGISVPDIDASIKWYHDMLGFSVVKRFLSKALPGMTVVFMKRGEFYIELFEVPGAEPLPDSQRYMDKNLATHGTAHISFEVDDLLKVVDILKNQGVEIVRVMGDKAAYIRDNSGMLLELAAPSSVE